LNRVLIIGKIQVTLLLLLNIESTQYYSFAKLEMIIHIYHIKIFFLCYFLMDQKVTKKSSGEINSSGGCRTQTEFRRL